jgi:hypothetical protein
MESGPVPATNSVYSASGGLPAPDSGDKKFWLMGPNWEAPRESSYEPEAPASAFRRGHPLAGASESTRQTTTIVTPSPRAIVSAQVLLELARWCQQRLATREENHLCYPVEPTQQSPPAPAEHAAGPGHSALARVDAPTASQSADPVDHPAAPTRRPHRSPRNGGGR